LNLGLRGLSQPDRAVVESAAVVGTQWPPLWNVGAGVSGYWGRHGVLERPSASLSLGAAAPASVASSGWYRCAPKSSIDLSDAPLSLK